MKYFVVSRARIKLFIFIEIWSNTNFFLNWLPPGDRAENFFGNIISTRLKYTILKLKYIGK
jgi:hypothetical protein